VAKYLPFQKVKPGTVFRVVKERGRPNPEPGLWVKVSNARSNSAYRHAKTIILALGDMVEVLSTPKQGVSP
jgi:hypothetical protein